MLILVPLAILQVSCALGGTGARSTTHRNSDCAFWFGSLTKDVNISSVIH